MKLRHYTNLKESAGRNYKSMFLRRKAKCTHLRAKNKTKRWVTASPYSLNELLG